MTLIKSAAKKFLKSRGYTVSRDPSSSLLRRQIDWQRRRSNLSMSHDPIPSSLRHTVWRGGTFLLVRQLASILLSVIGVVLITRILGPKSYGAYAAALAIGQYAQLVGQIGIPTYLIREPGEHFDSQYKIASTLLLAISIVVALVLEGTANALGRWVSVEGFENLLRVLALFLPLQFLGMIAQARLERALDFGRVALVELISQIAYYVIAVPTALAGAAAWSLVLGWITQQALSCVLFHALSHHKVAFSWDGPSARRMISYGVQFAVAAWLWQMRLLVNPLLIGPFLGPDAVGYVALTLRLMEFLATVKTISWRLSMAAFARIQGNQEKLTEAITQAMQIQILAISPVVIAFGLVGIPVLLAIAGPRWGPMSDLYPYVAVAYVTNALFNMHASALHVVGRNFSVSLFNLVSLALLCIGCAASLHVVGLTAYGWGEIASLPSYWILHRAVIKYIGRPKYRVSAVWWLGTSLGLFWRELGWAVIAAPLIAALYPQSLRQIREYAQHAWTAIRHSPT